MRSLCSWTLVVLAVFGSGCTTSTDLHRRVEDVYYNAQVLLYQKKHDEAAQLLIYLKQLRPNDPQIARLIKQLPDNLQRLTDMPNWQGVSRAIRPSVEEPTWKRVLLFLPDRFGDFWEMFSIRISTGVMVGAGAWFTRGFQAVAYAGFEVVSSEIISLKYTKAGSGTTMRVEASLAAFGITYISESNGDFSGMRPYQVYADRTVWLHSPTDPLYSRYRDYWSVGAEGHFLFFGLGVEVHLLEVWDFFAGWLLFDPLSDDRATTRTMKRLGQTYNRYLYAMLEAASDVTYKELVEYREKPPPLTNHYMPSGRVEDGTKHVTPSSKR